MLPANSVGAQSRSAAPEFNVDAVPADTCKDVASFGIAGLEITDFLLVERETIPTSGITDSFRILDGPPVMMMYAVCSTTAGSIDPLPATFRVVALR